MRDAISVKKFEAGQCHLLWLVCFGFGLSLPLPFLLHALINTNSFGIARGYARCFLCHLDPRQEI
jgi:hypothetical protein